MNITIPENILFPNSSLRLYSETVIALNQHGPTIVIEGTRNGFLSLSNALLYLRNDLVDPIPIHELPFVEAQIRLWIRCEHRQTGRLFGVIKDSGDGNFDWILSDEESNNVAAGIHSLGHLNPELHLEKGFDRDTPNVYCVVS